MAAFMLLLQFVVYENSFDEFHQDSENIYRVRYDGYRNGQRMFACAAAVPAVGPSMKNNFPEVLEYSWAFPLSGVLSNDQNESYRERKIQIATPSFLSMLDWGMISGSSSALSMPNTIVLTESTARKYYGDEDPIGKTLKFGNEREFEIRGLVKDVPENSHIKFSALISAETLHQWSEGITTGLRQWKFTSSEEIQSNRELIISYVEEAIQNQKEGKEIKAERNKAVIIPEELKFAFRNSP